MNFVFLMDRLETVNVAKDTSFIFMVGAARKGHTCWFVPQGGMSLDDGHVAFDATQITPDARLSPLPFQIGRRRVLTPDNVDTVFVRTNPPFDQRYLMDTWLLDHLPTHIPVINAPRGMRTVNEKLWALRFTDLVPQTLVTRDAQRFDAFIRKHETAIVKPTDGFGGLGIFLVRTDDRNARVIFETLSDQGQREIILQEYIPEAKIGDKRILLLDGRPIGAVLRVHGEADHRNNFFAGGMPHPTDLTERDRHICDTLRPHLRELGLAFVGIDVIGEYLIEVNVTSPTCVQEINRLYDVALEDQVIEYVEGLAQKT